MSGSKIEVQDLGDGFEVRPQVKHMGEQLTVTLMSSCPSPDDALEVALQTYVEIAVHDPNRSIEQIRQACREQLERFMRAAEKQHASCIAHKGIVEKKVDPS